MPNRVTVVALKPFEYEGVTVREGEPVSMLPVDAAVHARRQHVSLTREVRRFEKPVAQTVTTRRRRRGGRNKGGADPAV